VVSDGRSTFFWTDNWLGGAPLWLQFPRLFDLVTDWWVIVEEMARRGWNEGGGAF